VACAPRPAAPITSAARRPRRARLMCVRRPRQRRRWRWLMRWCPHGVVILISSPASLVIPAGWHHAGATSQPDAGQPLCSGLWARNARGMPPHLYAASVRQREPLLW